MKERARGRHIAVVGAGPGGLTTAMLLAGRGYRVTVLEQAPWVGGRNAELRLGPYRFDTGPTFLMLRRLLEELFAETGRRCEDYLTFRRLDPMYRLQFDDARIDATTDTERMRQNFEVYFPDLGRGLEKYFRRETRRFAHVFPCMQRPYLSISSLLRPDLLAALPYLSLGRSLFQVLGDYFPPERLRLSFAFQSKYLGMSPWECPGLFAILSYIEHAFGIDHVEGGLSQISLAMAAVIRELGGEIRINAEVGRLLLQGRTVQGVELADGERLAADAVVVNADFGHAMTHLVPPGTLRKWRPERLAKKEFSCSTVMLYLGLDKLYDLPHHTIFFARDYRANLEAVFRNKRLTRDFSFYIRNASPLDPSLAPAGHSAVYILVPVPNQTSGLDWEVEAGPFRELVLQTVIARTQWQGLVNSIRAEKMITPRDWERDFRIYAGATFNLSHKLSQMLSFRPRNRFEELGQCYLSGGGTHPGSGLPTIFESGRITANLIDQDFQRSGR